MDPLAGTNWSTPGTVSGFAQAPPNSVLMRFAEAEARRAGEGRALDLGCGAGRNGVPLAGMGWKVLGLDLSWPMLVAAAARGVEAGLADRLAWALAPMDHLPARDRSFDLIVAHGIWNLAPSTHVFRRAVEEAARVARPGAGLFVFTFSRSTFGPEVQPVPGEPFVFTQFSGDPQCFLTGDQLLEEMDRAGFALDPAIPMTEYNRPPEGAPRLSGPPVIHEAAFRLRGAGG